MLESELNVINWEKSRSNVSKMLTQKESHHFLSLINRWATI